MYVDTAHSYQNGKKHTRHLLRESYRENGKVKHRTIANISHCSAEEISALKLALKHKGKLSDLKSISELTFTQGSQVGAIFCLNTVAHRLGLPEILGHHRQGKLALWQIFARIIDQGSRLSAVRLAGSHGADSIIGLEEFTEYHLYDNLAWLSRQQEEIEKRLYRKRYGQAAPQLFLYDVTSSYLEGDQNALAAYGYNRDKKQGKKQIVIGLLAGPDGAPVAVRVFEGNTIDPQTVADQIRILAETFEVRQITLVGDRGMIKNKQVDLLAANDFHYISAITKPQIRTLMNKGVIQLGLFDNELCEVSEDGVRYVLRRNPVRQEEISKNREDKLLKLAQFAIEQTQYLADHPRAKTATALGKIQQRCERYGLDSFVSVELAERTLNLTIDQTAKENLTALDGCYVLKTDLTAEAADMATVHARYKDLAMVEKAFRTWKTGHLELRPIFVRSEESTRGHVFVVMLAYLLERELAQYWRDIDITVAEGIDQLSSLCGIVIDGDPAGTQKIPQPNPINHALLEAADIKLPQALPYRTPPVATRGKIAKRRKIIKIS